MLKLFNILKGFKTLLLVLSLVFALSACNNDESAKETGLVPSATSDEQVDEMIKKQRESDCWQKGVLILIYDTLGKATMNLYTKITTGALPFMMMAFAVWFAFRMLNHVGSFTEENIAEVWKEVIGKFFMCFICGIVASSSATLVYLLNILIFPVYTAFLEFGSYIMQEGIKVDPETRMGVYENAFGEKITFETPLLCKVTGSLKASIDGGFPDAPKHMMSCMACSVNQRLVIGAKIAFNSMKDTSWISWILGALVYVCFLFVRLGFIFYLVDTVFRFAIMIILLPVFVMSYAFKATKSWTTSALLMIVNSAAFMCAIAIILTITMLAMEELFSSKSGLLSGRETKDAKFEDFSVMFLCIILICFLLLQSINVAKQIADSLVGGGGSANFQKKLKKTVQAVGNVVMAVLTGGASKAGQAVAQGAKKAGQTASKAGKKMGNKVKSAYDKIPTGDE